MACGLAGVIALATDSALASGFALIEQSVSGMGTAYAIGSAGIDDASTVFFNPAGMSRLPGSRLSGGLQIVNSRVDIDASATYSGNLALATPPPNGLGISGLPIMGDGSTNTNLTAAVPSGYISHQYSDKVWLGLGVNAPFGLKTDYDDDWVGRYHAIKSQLYTYNFNPSLAFRLDEHATIGIGVSALYADGELTNAVDVVTGNALQGNPAIPGCPPVGSGIGTCDSKAKLTGDDWGYGFNLGVLLEPSDNTRLGLHYRSKIDLELEGDAKISGPVLNSKQDAKLDLKLPNNLSLSAYHALNERWALMADVTWWQWSKVSSLDVKLEDGSQNNTVWDYEDVTRVAIGAEYKFNPDWTLRTGVAYDESPVPSDSLRSPRVPDNDRTWLSFGATWHYSPDITFDFGYAHLFVDDPELDAVSDANDPTLPFPVGLTGLHSLSGDYDAAVDILGAQVNWKFR
ncbi:MAG: outer membrane protein transport protein [Gammaproteobacteria bacterium]|jgi:long-chain fatty acid transport protein